MCAFFLLAERASLTIDEICRPDVALDLAACARRELDPWSSYASAARQEVLARAPTIANLARATLGDPRTRWWSEPVPLERQAWLCSSGDGVPEIVTPTDEPTAFETYAQRPRRWFVTATEFDGRSSLHAVLAYQVGDWDPAYPLRQLRFQAAASARVYEINSAEHWHTLAMRYRSPASLSGTDSNGAGLVAGSPPAWAAVARDWDAVHLTFRGFLSATYVPSGPRTEATTLWTWNSEQTLWLRDVMTTRVERPPLDSRPTPAVGPIPFRLDAAMPVGSADRTWLRKD